MELTYYGANCLRISTKKASIVIDDNLEELGFKPVTQLTDISLHTFAGQPLYDNRFLADMPGEYEISGVMIHGVSARAYADQEGHQTAVIYTLATDDLRLTILGHVYPDLSEEQLEQIGHVDILVVPVGNNGYTLDGLEALKIVKKIEPKVIIPIHYADKVIKYAVPQIELAEALKKLAMEPTQTLTKYRPKLADITDATHLIVLERQ